MTDFSAVLLAAQDQPKSIPVHGVGAKTLEQTLEQLGPAAQNWAAQNNFKAKSGKILAVPGDRGALDCVLLGLDGDDHFATGALAGVLAPGTYRLAGGFDDMNAAVLGFLLGCYRFDVYKEDSPLDIRLVCPPGIERDNILRIAGGVGLARNLINTPANDMGPRELEDATRRLAERHGAKLRITAGDRLKKEFPMIAAVGRASSRPPRLLDMTWGAPGDSAITLVGKGICFDTGGLDIKPSSGMLLMKKDMGGAANALGLAHMIMDAGLPVRLRVLIPAAENAVGADAYRPGDILKSRAGISVEVGNTDAEGRLVLADALALADEDKPDLLISIATLTGAARVALGPDLPPFYADDDALASEIEQAAQRTGDPLWRMPFWRPYEAMLNSPVADTGSTGNGGFAGSITAALFLKKFVRQSPLYSHFDIYGWTPKAKPGRPVGGEAQAIRALFDMLCARYG